MKVHVEIVELYPFYRISESEYLTHTIELTTEQRDFLDKVMDDLEIVQMILKENVSNKLKYTM